MLRFLACVLALLIPMGSVAQETPKFDAIIVRPHEARDISQGGSINWNGLAFTAANIPLTFIMTQAFGVKKWLIDGLPPWASSARWDVNAKVDEADVKTLQSLDREQRSRMLQAILTEQFGLRYHFEDRIEPVYELTVLPGGPKFRATTFNTTPLNPDKPVRSGNWMFFQGEVTCESITMPQFANGFSPLLERVVVDKTDLTGRYDLSLKWTPEDAAQNDQDSHPGVFTAVREQLGLKLTPAKAPVPVLVVDALARPEAQ